MATVRGKNRGAVLAERVAAIGHEYAGLWDGQWGSGAKTYYLYVRCAGDDAGRTAEGTRNPGCYCLHFKGIDELERVTSDAEELRRALWRERYDYHAGYRREDIHKRYDALYQAKKDYGREAVSVFMLELGEPLSQWETADGRRNSFAVKEKQLRAAYQELRAAEARIEAIIGPRPPYRPGID